MSVELRTQKPQVMVPDSADLALGPSYNPKRVVNARVNDFITTNNIATDGIVKVEVERYYSCWDIMCGDTEPDCNDCIEITYRDTNNRAYTRSIEVENISFGEEVADALKMHIPGGMSLRLDTTFMMKGELINKRMEIFVC